MVRSEQAGEFTHQFINHKNISQSPGNHEFDDGVSGYVPYLKNVTFPIICANIDVSEEPSMAGLYNKSVVVTRSGKKIGLIGYLTPETSVRKKISPVSSEQFHSSKLRGPLSSEVELEGVPDLVRRPRLDEKLAVDKPNTRDYPGPNIDRSLCAYMKARHGSKVIRSFNHEIYAI